MDYTPTTEEVRSAWMDGLSSLAPEFDRWLTEVKADIWDEGFSAQLWSEQSRNPYRKGENK